MDDLEHFQALYEAFNRCDIGAVLAMMSEEVDWPNAWKGGRLTGREAVRDALQDTGDRCQAVT